LPLPVVELCLQSPAAGAVRGVATPPPSLSPEVGPRTSFEVQLDALARAALGNIRSFEQTD
jgi:hypothetical protein